MIRLRVLLAAAALVVAGCTSSGGGATTSAPPSAAAGGSKLAATVAATMRKGMSGLTSAHLTIDAGGLGGKSTGDVKYSNGQATASRFTVDAGGTAHIVTVGDTTWAMLPPGRNTTGKPWIVVSNDSSNEFVRALSSQVSLTKAVTSLPAIADAVAAAASVTDRGTTAGGHEYALRLDPSKVSDPNLGGALRDLGENPVPITVLLDRSGRPTRLTIAVKLGTSSFPIAIEVGSFNAPLTITAPPANQVTR